jgi:hypothetical protein
MDFVNSLSAFYDMESDNYETGKDNIVFADTTPKGL